MAVAPARTDHTLEVYLYPDPNPAITGILIGPQMAMTMQYFGLKVAANYIAQNPVNTSDPGRANRKGGHPVGTALETLTVSTPIGGMKHDRRTAEVSVRTPYAPASNYGRHTPTEAQGLGSSYVGQQKLQRALVGAVGK
jgi:hypothetical protein